MITSIFSWLYSGISQFIISNLTYFNQLTYNCSQAVSCVWQVIMDKNVGCFAAQGNYFNPWNTDVDYSREPRVFASTFITPDNQLLKIKYAFNFETLIYIGT